MNDREFLEGIKNGAMSIEDGLEYMKDSNYKDLGFAKIDFDRKKRRHLPEVIFAQSKSDEHLMAIFKSFFEKKRKYFGNKSEKRTV